MSWDMNNLYGTVMSFDYLPYEGFRFLSKEEIKLRKKGLIWVLLLKIVKLNILYK